MKTTLPRLLCHLAIILPLLFACYSGKSDTFTGQYTELFFRKVGAIPLTNTYLVKGSRTADRFLFEVSPVSGDDVERYEVGREDGILRVIRQRMASGDRPASLNLHASIEPFLVPRQANKPTKITALVLNPTLLEEIHNPEFPIIMSVMPPYPVYQVSYAGSESNDTLVVEATLDDGGRKSRLWSLQRVRSESKQTYEYMVDYEHFSSHHNSSIDGYPQTRKITGVLRFAKSSVPSKSRPEIQPDQRINNFTILDQNDILRAIDNSSQIAGAVVCIATNNLWEFDPTKPLEDAPKVSAYIAQNLVAADSSTRWWFLVAVIVFLAIPIMWRLASKKKTVE